MDLELLVDPEYQDLYKNAQNMDVSNRKWVDEAKKKQALEPPIEGVDVTYHTITGAMGEPTIKLRIHRPTELQGELPVLLYVMGNGFLFMGIDEVDISARWMGGQKKLVALLSLSIIAYLLRLGFQAYWKIVTVLING